MNRRSTNDMIDFWTKNKTITEKRFDFWFLFFIFDGKSNGRQGTRT